MAPDATLVERRKRRGAKLRTARESAGLSARQLARRLAKGEPGTDEFQKEVERIQRNLRRYENGHNTPSGEILLAILRELDMDASSFGDDEEQEDALEQHAREVVAPFQRRDGGSASSGVPRDAGDEAA
jgi:transcriptional regulator with XRE-family HTH domain